MKITPTSVACLITGCLFAHGACAFTLEQAWQAALQYNSDQAAARAERDAGLQQSAKGLAALLPQLSLQGNYQHAMPQSPEPTSDVHSRSYQLSLSQSLIDLSRVAQYQKGQHSAELAEIRFQIDQQQRYAEVAKAYYGVLQAQDTLAATQASQKAYADQLKRAQLSLETGLGNQVDVNEAQASYDGAKAKAISDENALEIQQQNLQVLTGLNPLDIQPVDSNVPLPDKPLQDWLTQADAQNLNIKAAELLKSISQDELTASKSGHLPTLTLEGSHGESRSNESNWLGNPVQPKRENRIGLQLNIPLFSGGGIRAQVLESAALKEAAHHKLESSKRQAREEIRKAYLSVIHGWQQIHAQEQLLKSAQSKVDSTLLGRDVGIRTQQDVLQAEQGYYETLTSLASAKYQYLNNWIQLKQLVNIN